MFLHLGGDHVVNQNKVIAILDLESCKKGSSTDRFIKREEKEGNIEYICEVGKEKTFIITKDKSYFSPISSMTLLKRSTNLNFMED